MVIGEQYFAGSFLENELAQLPKDIGVCLVSKPLRAGPSLHERVTLAHLKFLTLSPCKFPGFAFS
jgi:hypothetical protein